MKTEVHQLIPALRFPEFEGEWEKKKLKDILEFKNGINASKDDYGFGFKFINVLDIIENDFITHDKIIGKVNVSQEIFEKNLVQYGDILFQRSSETREEVGQSNVYLDKGNSATFGGFVIRGRKIGEYDPFFFHLLLKSSIARKEITSKAGGSTRYNVGQGILSSIVLSFAGLPEQQKIASFLTIIDSRIQALEKKKSSLEQYKKGVMQKIFTQEIRFKDEDGKDFSEWEEKKLGEVYSFLSTNSFSRDKLNYDKGKTRNIHYGDIHTKFSSAFKIKNEKVPYINDDVDISQIKDESFCQEGDIVIADASEDYADIGKTIELVKLHGEKLLAGLHTFLARPISTNTKVGFSCHLFKSWKVRKQIMIIAQGTKVLGISKGRMSKISIEIPSIQEQTHIANFLTAIDKKIALVNEQIEKTKAYKKGLLQKMFV